MASERKECTSLSILLKKAMLTSNLSGKMLMAEDALLWRKPRSTCPHHEHTTGCSRWINSLSSVSVTLNNFMTKISLALGVKAKDKITWFTWIVTAHIKYLTGCDRWQITPEAKADGTLPDSMAFDENAIEVLAVGVSKQFDTSVPKKTGGPAVYKVGKANSI